MAISPGSRLGVYEVLSVIGEGGMGKVYRARDTKLQRHVAIKVLPDAVTGDAERVARFDREARTLATLNHPHIAQIYGTEQSGSTHALVMELVEGEDLALRIARGAIPWHEAEPIARQIAEALEAAHEMGIVHRDLKPANIKVTPDGVVKVLDFGLAKATDQGSGIGDQGSGEGANSPTITSPAGVTQAGMILGTAAYMSPEQSKGRPADKRSDVWAFGCVLYEMLTGRRAFPGADVMETLSAVIRAEPDLNALPTDVPPGIRTLIGQCLIKDRRERISDIAVARYALRTRQATPAGGVPTGGARFLWPMVAVVAIAAAVVLAWPSFNSAPAAPPPVIRSVIAAPTADTKGFATVAMSRQGTHIAYASTQGRLHVRRLSEAAARPLPGSEGGVNPFFSPDGEWVGFFADGQLKKVPVAGGAAQVLVSPRARTARGGSWASDGTIVFAPTPESGLFKVSDQGGEPTRLTTPSADHRSHRWPHVLPDGKHVLYTVQLVGKPFDDAAIAVVPLSGGEPRIVIEGGSAAQFAESGHLVYAKAGSLLAMRFDPVAVTTSGAAITVIDNARTNLLNGAAPFAMSSGGVLIYLAGTNQGSPISLLSANRAGQPRLLLDQRSIENTFRISPDGRRVAVAINDGQADLWLVELDNRGINRFTFGPGSEYFPVWSPDGSRIYFTSNAGGVRNAMVKAIDGGVEEAIAPSVIFPFAVSPDDRTLAGLSITNNNLSTDVVALELSAQPTGRPLIATNANETAPAFSPDGQFLAYQSDESGRPEVFVQEYPSGNKWQVTTGGGREPSWTQGGRELIFRNGATLFAVAITLRPFSAGPAQALFTIPYMFAYDVSADGRRFVVAQDGENPENVDLVLISGWFEELRAKMQPAR